MTTEAGIRVSVNRFTGGPGKGNLSLYVALTVGRTLWIQRWWNTTGATPEEQARMTWTAGLR